LASFGKFSEGRLDHEGSNQPSERRVNKYQVSIEARLDRVLSLKPANALQTTETGDFLSATRLFFEAKLCPHGTAHSASGADFPIHNPTARTPGPETFQRPEITLIPFFAAMRSSCVRNAGKSGPSQNHNLALGGESGDAPS